MPPTSSASKPTETTIDAKTLQVMRCVIMFLFFVTVHEMR